jgi:hypothetical protein
MPLALLALAIGAFGIGTTEFVIMGVLPEVAAAHGAFFGIGSVVAADLVAPDKKASAISPMFMGLTVANTTDAGPTLSRDDAVGLKVRALHDRGFPRDVIDVFSARPPPVLSRPPPAPPRRHPPPPAPTGTCPA